MIQEEEWHIIKNLHHHNDLYFISKTGSVKRKAGYILNGLYFTYKEERILSQSISRGYKNVTLILNGVPKKYKVHRLLANTFIKNPENKQCVTHKDEDTLNNCLSNLKWITYEEITLNAFENNKRCAKKGNEHYLYGKKGHRTRLIFCQNTGYFYDSIRDAANSIGAHESYLAMCLRGKRQNNTSLIYA